MSRARLGLYVFARSSLFSNCFELTPTFRLLLERPTQLHLLPKELHPTQREIDVPLPDEPLVIEDMPRMAGFVSDFYRYRVAQIANDPEAPKPWAKTAEQLAAEQAQQMEEEAVEESSSEDESTPQPEVAIVNEIEMEEGGRQGTKVQETQEEVEEKEEEATPATD